MPGFNHTKKKTLNSKLNKYLTDSDICSTITTTIIVELKHIMAAVERMVKAINTII